MLPVKKASDSFLDDGAQVFDKITKDAGVRLDVSKLNWISKDEVTANGGSQIGNMGADGCTYTLKREKGLWRISATQRCWIS